MARVRPARGPIARPKSPMPIASDALYQLIYISTAVQPFGERELSELLRHSRRSNQTRGLTGMLLYHEGSFLQVLEGPKQEVLRLYARIERDPRHVTSRVLLRGEVPERSFAGWAMGFYRTTSESEAELQGFPDVLAHGFAERVRQEPDRARTALLAFRRDAWRPHVSVSIEPAA